MENEKWGIFNSPFSIRPRYLLLIYQDMIKPFLQRTLPLLATLPFFATPTAQAATPLHAAKSAHFAPLLADPLEPRVAVEPFLGEKSLQLDIGTTEELYRNDKGTFAAGVDFATWSLLRRSNNFKFPVDAIDYLFGVNASWKMPLQNSSLPFDDFNVRARLSHISAHFEDGHYQNGQWLQQAEWQGTIPFVYSREFVNVVLALSAPEHRIYTGYQYLYNALPSGINPHSWQAGVEIATTNTTYVAADMKLLPIWQTKQAETEGFRASWNFQAGMRLKGKQADKVRLVANYYTGMSRHGMYFYHPENYSTIGAIIDF